MKKIIYIVAGTISATLVVAMIVTASLWPMINDVETGATPEYPEVQPHYYATEPGDIFREAVDVVDDLERWEVVDDDSSEHLIEAERTTDVFNFVDDITIRIEPVTEYVSQVHLRSRSRVGEADLGQNARNIDEFLTELDGRMGGVRFDPEAAESPEDADGDGEAVGPDESEGVDPADG